MLDKGPASEHEFRIRRLSAADVTVVQQILQQAAGAAEWSEEAIRNSLNNQQTIALVSEYGEEVSGCIFGTQLGEEAEILNLAVKLSCRRRGGGGELVRRVLADWRGSGTKRVFLEVRESNSGAIGFYEDLGFRPVGRRKKYYAGPEEDALVLERNLERK